MLPRWYPHRGDPQLGVFIQKHARSIAREHQVLVFYATSETDLSTNLESEVSTTDGVKEYRYYYPSAKGWTAKWRNMNGYLKCWRQFQADVKLFNENGFTPDLLHPYIILRTVLICWILQLRHRIPYVYSEQWSGYVTGKFQQYNFVHRWLIRRALRKAAAVSAVSNFLKKSLAEISGRKDIEITYNVIETTSTNSIPLHGTLQDSGKTFNGTDILLVADLVDDIKNIRGVIRVMSLLTSQRTNIRLRIIGHGKDEHSLKTLADELGVLNRYVFFEGLKDNPTVYHYLNECDFLVMNSRFETFSLICAEALSCGKPVIATRCGGPEEIIEASCGELIPVNDDNALQAAMERMIHHHTNYDPQKLKDYAAARFSIKASTTSFNRLYDRVQRD